MVQPELIRTLDTLDLGAPKSGVGKAASTTPDDKAIAGPSDTPAQGKDVKRTCLDPPSYFGEALAERLLKYAAEVGVDVDEDIRDHILQARAAGGAGWEQATAANLLKALTALAA